MGAKHHYVPRFYLKSFSADGRRINLWNLAREKSLNNVSLRDQCYRHHLYGETDELESTLAEIETAAAAVFRQIGTEKALPEVESDTYKLLSWFVALQLVRTAAARDDVARSSALMTHTAFEGKVPSNYVLTPDEAMRLSLRMSSTMVESIADLTPFLIIAPAKSEYVTSDNPAFRYNQYCEGVKYSGVTGAQMVGFQIFFPLTPDLLLCLVDTGVYKVGSRRRSATIDATPADVDALNRAQIVSAADNVYFREWGIASRISGQHATVRKVRRLDRPHVNVAEGADGETSTILHQYWPMPQLALSLSFISIRRNARRTPLFERTRQRRPAHARAAVDRTAGGTSRRYEVKRRV